MFNLSTQEVVSSIEKTPLVNLNGIFYQEYDNFFGNDFDLTIPNDVAFEKLRDQESLPRAVVSKDSLTHKTLSVFFMQSSITEALQHKFDTNLKFSSFDLWQDTEGYYLGPHTDHGSIKLSLQIYLGHDNAGTVLFDDQNNIIKTFPFKYNSGYAFLNTKESIHGTEGRVGKGTRNSLYVRYK